MAKIIKLKGPIQEFTVAGGGGLFEGVLFEGGLFEGGLLTICSSRMGAYSRERASIKKAGKKEDTYPVQSHPTKSFGF